MTKPGFGEGPDDIPLDKKASLHTVDRLSENTAVAEGIMLSGIDLLVVNIPGHGCWVITPYYVGLTRPVWDCCQAIAEALLAMPMPKSE
jgi:hypothetical protein